MRKVVKGGEVRFSVAASRESSLGLWDLGVRYPVSEPRRGGGEGGICICRLSADTEIRSTRFAFRIVSLNWSPAHRIDSGRAARMGREVPKRRE